MKCFARLLKVTALYGLIERLLPKSSSANYESRFNEYVLPLSEYNNASNCSDTLLLYLLFY